LAPAEAACWPPPKPNTSASPNKTATTAANAPPAKRSQAAPSGSSTPTLARTTRDTWDAEDHLTAWTDTDHSRDQSTSAQLSYDAAGRKTSETITYPGISGNASIAGAGAESTCRRQRCFIIYGEGSFSTNQSR